MTIKKPALTRREILLSGCITIYHSKTGFHRYRTVSNISIFGLHWTLDEQKQFNLLFLHCRHKNVTISLNQEVLAKITYFISAFILEPTTMKHLCSVYSAKLHFRTFTNRIKHSFTISNTLHRGYLIMHKQSAGYTSTNIFVAVT